MNQHTPDLPDQEYLRIFRFRDKIAKAKAFDLLKFAVDNNITHADELLVALTRKINISLDDFTDYAITELAYKFDPNDPVALIQAKKVKESWVAHYVKLRDAAKDIFKEELN